MIKIICDSISDLPIEIIEKYKGEENDKIFKK